MKMKQKGSKIIGYGLVATMLGYFVANMGTSLLVNLIANLIFIVGPVVMIVGLVMWITGLIHEKKGLGKK